MSAVVPPPTNSKNGLGIAGFALGLLGFLFSFVPIIGVISWPLGILALIFGILGIGRARGGAPHQGLAATGVVLAVLGLLICVIWVGAIGESAENHAEQAPAPQAGIVPRATRAPVELGFGAAHAWSGGERVQVSPPREGHGYPLVDDGRVAEVELAISNGTGHDINPLGWNITATHGGRPTKPVFTDDQLADARIPAGATIALTRAFQVPGEPGELRISVQPSFFAQMTAYFTGPF